MEAGNRREVWKPRPKIPTEDQAKQTPAQRKAPRNGESTKWGMHNMRPKKQRREKNK